MRRSLKGKRVVTYARHSSDQRHVAAHRLLHRCSGAPRNQLEGGLVDVDEEVLLDGVEEWSPERLEFKTGPRPTQADPQGLCLDKGYDDDEVRALAREFRITAHIRSRGEEG